MLMIFRLYERRVVTKEDEYCGSPGLSDPFEFDDAVLQISETTTDYCRIYNLEIIPAQLPSKKDQGNQYVTISPMNIEFCVFVGQKKTRSRSVSLCWFSLIELWHLLYYDRKGQGDIRVDDRMAGHFLFFQTLLTRFGMNKGNKTGQSGVNWWKRSTSHNEQNSSSWPIDDDTIFASDIALWHFIFASKLAKRAMFLARILCRYVYPTIENCLMTRVVHFATIVLNVDYYNYNQTKWSTFYSWLVSPLRSIRACRAANNSTHPSTHGWHEVKSINKQRCGKRIDEVHRCTHYSYPFMTSYFKYLKRQIGHLENQLIEAQRQLDDGNQYPFNRPSFAEINDSETDIFEERRVNIHGQTLETTV